MKKLLLVITTVALVIVMAFGVSAKSKVKSVKVKGVKKNITLTVGDKKTYTVKVKASKKNRTFKVKSSNKKIVKVTKKGKKITINALKKGKAKVTVTLKKDKRKKYKFTVVVNNKVWVDPYAKENEELAKKQKEDYQRRYEESLEIEKTLKLFESQGLKRDVDYYWGMYNGKEVCVLKYKNTYIDEEVLALLEQDKKEVQEKTKTDPNYYISRPETLWVENVAYSVDKSGYGIWFRDKVFTEYGCYNNTGELPSSENYDYKRVNGVIVEGTAIEDYTDDPRVDTYKYETKIGYDVDGNLVRLSKEELH